MELLIHEISASFYNVPRASDMILDQQSNMFSQIIEFPDWVFSDLPRFDQVKETIIIRGTNVDTSTSMGGTADERED